MKPQKITSEITIPTFSSLHSSINRPSFLSKFLMEVDFVIKFIVVSIETFIQPTNFIAVVNLEVCTTGKSKFNHQKKSQNIQTLLRTLFLPLESIVDIE